MPVVSPPQTIGARDVAILFGVTPDRIRRRLAEHHRPTRVGYLGKIGGKHVWNAHQLITSVFTSDSDVDATVTALLNTNPRRASDMARCGVDGCDDTADFAQLCHRHLRKFMRAWYHAPTSSVVLLQFVAMCRWVVDRNAHLVLPPGFDPFASTCITPGCAGDTNVHGGDGWHSPLCVDCTRKFWNNPPRGKPDWWRPPKTPRSRKAA